MEQSDFENWWNGKEKELKSMGLNFMAISRRRELYKEAWQASRAAIEIEIPDMYDNKYTPSSVTMDGFYFEEYHNDLQSNIRAAGLRVKEK